MYITQEVVTRIRLMLKSKNITQKELLAGCGININALTDFSKGRQLSCISLAKIADYLDCSVDYLLGRTDNPNITNSINNSNTTVNGTQANIINSSESCDEMTSELLKAFKKLSFKDKMEIMNSVLEKAE